MRTLFPLAYGLLIVFASPVIAQSLESSDWSSWGGPNRDFSVLRGSSKPLRTPRLVWERSLGDGHSAVVVDGEHCYCQYSAGKTEFVQKRNLQNGELIWETDYPVSMQSSRYPGPHATPAISQGKLVTASIDGQIHAFDVESGESIWRIDLVREFGTTLPQSGYASSPLIIDDLVIVPTLGKAQARETE
ncbi:MAG: PQQ-binding-like beta-propeller repeat protein, partial [Planctomycetota bacterium]